MTGTVPPSMTYSLPWIETARSDLLGAARSADRDASERVHQRLAAAFLSVPASSANRVIRPSAVVVSMKPGATELTRTEEIAGQEVLPHDASQGAGLVGIAFAATGYGRVSARRLVCKALHAW